MNRNTIHWIVLSTLVGFLVFVFLSSLSKGETITDNFQQGKRLQWSSNKITTAPKGEKFLGPLGQTSLTIQMPDYWHYVLISWDVYAIGSWPKGQAWTMSQYTPSNDRTQVFLGNHLLDAIGSGKLVERNTLGYSEGDRVYRMSTQLSGHEEWYRLDFNGGSARWGIDNVTVMTVVPEPSTLMMLIVGGLLIWRIKR